jgi:hypothetical protein
VALREKNQVNLFEIQKSKSEQIRVSQSNRNDLEIVFLFIWQRVLEQSNFEKELVNVRSKGGFCVV